MLEGAKKIKLMTVKNKENGEQIVVKHLRLHEKSLLPEQWREHHIGGIIIYSKLDSIKCQVGDVYIMAVDDFVNNEGSEVVEDLVPLKVFMNLFGKSPDQMKNIHYSAFMRVRGSDTNYRSSANARDDAKSSGW
jgi:hypothetical protein